jgi:extracellular elastinolytic metalloproteinase
MKFNITNLFFILGLLTAHSAIAQVQTPVDQALRYIEENHADWGLTDQDVSDLTINDLYTSKHNGVTHVYLLQRFEGIKVYNALNTINILPNGRVLFVGNRFLPNLADKINTTAPSLSAADAIQAAAAHLDLEAPLMLRLKEEIDDQTFIYEGEDLSRSDIQVQLAFQPTQEGKVKLAWDLAIEDHHSADYWSVRIDAINGDLLHKNNWTVYCQFDDEPYHNHDIDCRQATNDFQPVHNYLQEQNLTLSDGSVYNVFPIPVESPAHGSRSLVNSPADETASPFGWHDTNGADGAEFTITRGNNVHAYHDLDGNAAPPSVQVEGGASLNFDFPYDEALEPNQMIDASITNLFYMNNIMHDVFYQYGFDEDAGNFQQNNYGNGGPGGNSDYVNALGQWGGNDPFNLDALNNANFSTPPDGNNGTMRMYYWNTGARLLEITEPAVIAGLYTTGTAEYGPSVLDMPLSGEVVVVEDPTLDPYASDACEVPFVNADDLVGKIALLDRGGCYFEEKSRNAEDAGAIAVLLCNYEDAVVNLGDAPLPDLVEPTIPTLCLRQNDCALIRQYIEDGVTVILGEPEDAGAQFLSSDFDNGVIAHEYTHGISIRLTGGPSDSGCLDGEEQMGEGWSDFFALVATVKPGDVEDMNRGVGTYLVREPNNGKGIRPFPYTTDMNVNPVTYRDIVSASVPHGVGHVWCSMLWDLYWAFSEEYGWDPDIYNGTSGNNMAIQLVTDAMKMQPCIPGFTDGRDAILAADEALYGGANQCLIWEVFARRGLGYYADQGLSFSNGDGVEDFEPLPPCIEELKVRKTASEFAEAGEEIEYELYVVNHKPTTATGVVLTDEIPAGLNYVSGSASLAPTSIDGNELTWELGDMGYAEEITITYEVEVPQNQFSLQYFYEDFEDGTIGTWATTSIGDEADNEWIISELFSNSGEQSYFVENISSESQQVLQTLLPLTVQGDNPALRFFHRFSTDAGADGGIVEISTDFGITWSGLSDNFFLNPYSGPIAYGTFVVPNLEAFFGNSGGWIQSYADLSDYTGQDILMRFRFGTDEEIGGLGWFVDDVELVDVLSFNSEACVTSDEGDLSCDDAPNRGTIIESELPSSTDDLVTPDWGVSVFPNPADDMINVALQTEANTSVDIRISTIDGRNILNLTQQINGDQVIPIPVQSFAEGIYIVEVITPFDRIAKKVVLK